MSIRLVTFLGKPSNGSYTPVRHRWGTQVGPETPFSAVSLSEFLGMGAGDEVVVLATEAAWTCTDTDGRPHGERLVAAMAAQGRPVPRPPAPFLDPGQEEAHYWQHFRVLREALAAPAGTERVVLDLTHSYRVHPLLAAAVVGYTRALEPGGPELRVLYAAFEAVDKGQPVPLWDLTPLVELADWTWMLTLFLRTGRAAEAARTVRALGRSQRAAWATGDRASPPPALESLGVALEDFGAALTTLRTGELLHGRAGAAARLARALEAARPEVAVAFPPLAAMLDRVEAMVHPLVCEDLASAEGQAATAALARLYLDLERHLEAIATVREGWINRFARPEAVRPGGHLLGAAERERQAKEAWFAACPEVAGAVTGKRNDLLHAGYKEGGSMGARRVPGAVMQEVDRLARAAPDRAFLNLSNHPSAVWADSQRSAAEALGGGIVDLALPEVPPEASLAAVEAMAEEVILRVPAHVAVAMVMGESVLCAALVARLQARGVRCVAATTRREVALDADGVKHSRFQFVAFRDYPDSRS